VFNLIIFIIITGVGPELRLAGNMVLDHIKLCVLRELHDVKSNGDNKRSKFISSEIIFAIRLEELVQYKLN